jgi:hypothetical protein
VQLLAFFSVYLLGGVGCALFAAIRCARRHPLDLATMVLLWPLCAPFLFASPVPAPGGHHRSCPPEEVMRVLSTHCEDLGARLQEIDAVLGQESWDPEVVASKRAGLGPDGSSVSQAGDALSVRLDHIERLHFVRKVHATELEEAQALLDQLQSQEQLSRFLVPTEGDEHLHLDAIRERIADSERMLASETELIALCHESL